MKYDRKGLVGTISFHSIVVLLLLFFGIEFPWPPPETGGIEVNIGYADEGAGKTPPARTNTKTPTQVPVETQTKSEPVTSTNTAKDIITSNDPESVTVQSDKKKTEKNQEKTVEKTTITKKKKVVEEDPLSEDEKFSFSKSNSNNNSSSEGDSKGNSDKGNPNGNSLTAPYYGDGGGSGNVPHANLRGRTAISLPQPKVDYQYYGVVVVTIKVDKNGRVISAVAGAQGTTITDKAVQDAIEKYALRSTFNESEQFQQEGTIKYVINPK